jgi:hypothetical protein
MKEHCVICGSETDLDVSTPVVLRSTYIAGCGQLCHTCFWGLCLGEEVEEQVGSPSAQGPTIVPAK